MHDIRGVAVKRDPNYHSTDLEQTRLAIAEHFYTSVIDKLDPTAPFSASIDFAHVGVVTLGDLRFTSDLRMRFGELGAYHVDLPLTGTLVWHQGRRDSQLATRHHAAVFHPAGDTELDRWGSDCRLIAVKLEREALQSHLEQLLGITISTPPQFAPTMEVTRGPGRTWAQLVKIVARDAVNPDGLLANPMIACRLQEAIVTGLLLAVDHRYREALTRPDSPGRPVLIKPAIDAVEAHPEQPFTATALAKIAGVSVRTLQQAFRHHLDMPPMTYLRQVRLARAHDDLRTGDHAHMTVAQIARKWGFAHAGRFAAAYCARYGIHPSKTLRRRL